MATHSSVAVPGQERTKVEGGGEEDRCGATMSRVSHKLCDLGEVTLSLGLNLLFCQLGPRHLLDGWRFRIISFMCRHGVRETPAATALDRTLVSTNPWRFGPGGEGGDCLIQSWSPVQLKRPKLLGPDDFPEMGDKNDPLPHSIHLIRWGGKQLDQPQ